MDPSAALAIAGFTYARAARELGISVAGVRALLRSGRLRYVERAATECIDPIAVYDRAIEVSLWSGAPPACGDWNGGKAAREAPLHSLPQ